jgi:hypothetical protein
MKKLAITVMMCALAAGAEAEDSYFLGWGTAPAIVPGTQTWMSVTSFVFDSVGCLIDGSPIDHWIARFLKFAVVDLYAGAMAFTVNHEFLGHGMRALEFGHPIYGIISRFPGPGGSIEVEPFTYGNRPIERMLFDAGGLESCALLAHEARKLAYAGGETRYYLFVYISKQVDIFMNAYGGQTKDPRKYPNDFMGGDTMKYLLSLTEKEGYYDGLTLPPPSAEFPQHPPGLGPEAYINGFLLDAYDRAMAYAWLVFLDPSLYTSLYGIVKYIVDGDEKITPIMLDAWGLRLMPGVGVAYGEFGPEFMIDLYGNYGRVPFSVYYRQGGSRDSLLLGCGFETWNVGISPSFFLNAAADVWSGWKLNAQIGCTWMIAESFGISAELGYKSEGYLMGRQYAGGIHFNGGIRACLQ